MIRRLLAGAVLAMFIGGCGGRDSTPNAIGPGGVFHSAGAQNASAREYRVDPPDVILIHSADVKEYDSFKTTVRPDGKITVPLIGEFEVTGLTPSEIGQKLAAAAQAHGYRQPPAITVEVSPQSKFFYVFGYGALRTGKVPYTGGVTVVSALAEAGFTITSWPQQVRVSRPGRAGAANATAVVDFTKIWDFGDVSQNYLLEDGDIIYIPITPLAAWGEATRELFEPLSNPVGLAATAAVATHGGY